MAGNLILYDDGFFEDARRAPELADVYLRELIEDAAEHAAEALGRHSRSGNVEMLTSSTRAGRHVTGGFEAIAGVEADVTEEGLSSGLGSDPADWPVYLDVGSGRYGPQGRDIMVIPGNVMVFEIDGRTIFTTRVKGQRPRHYSQAAYEDTMAMLPLFISNFIERFSDPDLPAGLA